jgi:hypothetical protein
MHILQSLLFGHFTLQHLRGALHHQQKPIDLGQK